MTALAIDGAAQAGAVLADVRARAARMARRPGLAVILVGDDPASHVYVRSKLKRAAEVGFESRTARFSLEVSEADILAHVAAFNAAPEVDGILVQLPLPDHINTLRVMAAIDPDKDVDGLHALNAGKVAQGGAGGLTPCTPLGCLMLIKSVAPDLTGMNAVVLGSSNIVGKPMAALLLAERATVTVAHIHTRDTPFLCCGADVLVTAVGKPRLVRADWIKPGAIVIDVGINRVATPEGGSRLVGDVDFDAVREVASAITPVPGGVGPMTIACLMLNTLTAAQARQVG
ncbi:bifunctional methylenetetrahydrofolate dehydrogenase/methenyltetrahydrofolate cyclohydrolase [Sphingomonas panacis]|uniref:Bifunctional protein FolD n=1 Tax=Sphingomonas panacis TaxID=1560345 RepID=A0A1B3ZA83_9SPHN|nr:bifunctional methylenetetrahydrofolate dehydrogenase/methenyltetrahydrofolate cyclohydrolase FolD [Sphingomonas panacis]AOH84336.1 bifunctional methylenetetrahydrofolate dehydrogenase/methenyltetrahydrofolate cyclohydrolase [Sphingomonas panacis]